MRRREPRPAPLQYYRSELGDRSSATDSAICIGILCAAAPPVYLWMEVYSAALQCVMLYRAWPSYGRPDPKVLPPSMLFEWILPLLFTAAIYVVIALLIRRYARPRNWISSSLLVCASSWFLSGMCCVFDPLGLFNWIMD